MTWFKVDDRLHDHRKARAAGSAAMGLWVLAGSWAAANETDGFVPQSVLSRWSSKARALAKQLCVAGLWSQREQDGEPGYLFHDWDEYQPSRKELQVKRDAARDRMQRVRANRRTRSREQDENVRANASGTSPEVRSTPSRSRPDPSSSSSSPSPRATIAAVTDATDDETTKVIDLIQTECHPTALGPYIRRLADNGDLPGWLDRVRGGDPTVAPSAFANRPPHDFEPDPADPLGQTCLHCPLPETSTVHRHLRVAGQ